MSRICFVAKYGYPTDTRLRQQVMALSARHAIDILCLAYGNQPERERIDNCDVKRLMTAKTEKSGFGGYLLFSGHFAFRCWTILLRHLLRDRFDLIVVHTLPEFLIFTALFNKLCGSGIVLDMRDVTVELLGSRWKRRRGIKILRILCIGVEQCAAAVADCLIVASNGFRQRLEKRGVPRRKTRLLPNTADHRVFVPDLGRRFSRLTRGAILLYHGTVAPRFGLATAVEALSIVNKTIPGSILKIYGLYDSRYKADLAGLIGALGLQGNVLLGPIKELSEIYEIICQSDFGVVPYGDDEFMNLALSTKTFEYVASGLPVVASRLRSTSELFPENSVAYFSPGDASELAEKIIGLCADPEDRKSRANAALKAYAPYAGGVNAEKFDATIRDLLETRKS